MITTNEKKILRFLLAQVDRDHSINEIAKRCGLAPNGAYEILRKLEKKAIVQPKKIANLRSYKINFNNREAKKMLELIIIPHYNETKIRNRYNDLKPLENITKLCIIFGSSITQKEKPNDIDILFVITKANYKKYNQLLDKVKMIVPLKVHDVIQTPADLYQNILHREPLIVHVLSEGVVLWGHEFLIEVIKNVAERKA